MKTDLSTIARLLPLQLAERWRKAMVMEQTVSAADNCPLVLAAPLSLANVLEYRGLDTALWCLRAVHHQDGVLRRFAVFCVRSSQHLLVELRSLATLAVAERYSLKEADPDVLFVAWGAANKTKQRVSRNLVSAGLQPSDSAQPAAREAGWVVAIAAASYAASSVQFAVCVSAASMVATAALSMDGDACPLTDGRQRTEAESRGVRTAANLQVDLHATALQTSRAVSNPEPLTGNTPSPWIR